MTNKKAIGVWAISNNFAVELLEINHGIDDEAVIRALDEVTSHIIEYNDEGDPYIEVGETVLHLDECMRV